MQSCGLNEHGGRRAAGPDYAVEVARSAKAAALGASALAATLACLVAAPAQAAEVAAARAPGELEEVIVTARRVEENLQKVPVSVQAFSAEELKRASVTELRQLMYLSPGVVLTGAGSTVNINYSIRGQAKTGVGPGLPGVITYVNEVPLPTWASSLPAYDMKSIQVLKGPQGTLFGRNTTGGAILAYTHEPVDGYEGYAKATFGNYNAAEFEGAVNVPIVRERASLRVAGLVSRRDGYTRNESHIGGDFDARHDNSYRVSLKLTPIDHLTNLTVADYMHADTAGSGSVLYAVNPTAVPPHFPNTPALAARFAAFNCNVSPSCDVDLALARQQAAGPRHEWTSFAPRTRATVRGVSNTTTFAVGGITLKNILGYRTVKVFSDANNDGTEMAIVDAHNVTNEKSFTDEAQVSGKLFNDRLSWLVGGFYLRSKPGGVQGLALETLRVAPLSTIVFTQSNYSFRSKALFLNASYDLSDMLPGVTINGGYRKTWDDTSLCSSTPLYVNPPLTPEECSTRGSFNGSTSETAPSWTFGVNYQATERLFLYATTRRGYRGGGINSPQFNAAAPRSIAAYQQYAPETLTDVELGAKADWRLGSWVGRFNLALFRGVYKDIQSSLNLPVNFDGDNNPATDPAAGNVILNRGKARMQGGEIQAVVSPIRNLTFTGGAAYLDAEYTRFNNPAIFAALPASVPQFVEAPRWTVSAAAQYVAELPGTAGELAFHIDYYHSAKLYYGELPAPGYDLVNARVDWNEIYGRPVDVGLFVRNLGNEEYIRGHSLGTSSLGLFAASFGEPRMYGMQVAVHF